jgi:hypothetical protein
MTMKFRLDFWNKSWWNNAGNVAKGAVHAFADVLLPAKLARAVGVVADLVDDGKLNDSAKPGQKVYDATRSIFTYIYMLILAVLLANGIINFDQFVNQVKEVMIPFLLDQPLGMFFGFSLFAVVHGQLYRVKTPVQNPDTKIYGQGEPPQYYEFRGQKEDGTPFVCRDNFDSIVTASSYVDYPHGADVTKRKVSYIEENSERFELIEPEPEEEI